MVINHYERKSISLNNYEPEKSAAQHKLLFMLVELKITQKRRVV